MSFKLCTKAAGDKCRYDYEALEAENARLTEENVYLKTECESQRQAKSALSDALRVCIQLIEAQEPEENIQKIMDEYKNIRIWMKNN